MLSRSENLKTPQLDSNPNTDVAVVLGKPPSSPVSSHSQPSPSPSARRQPQRNRFPPRTPGVNYREGSSSASGEKKGTGRSRRSFGPPAKTPRRERLLMGIVVSVLSSHDVLS
jgi:hypothetical protein